MPPVCVVDCRSRARLGVGCSQWEDRTECTVVYCSVFTHPDPGYWPHHRQPELHTPDNTLSPWSFSHTHNTSHDTQARVNDDSSRMWHHLMSKTFAFNCKPWSCSESWMKVSWRASYLSQPRFFLSLGDSLLYLSTSPLVDGLEIPAAQDEIPWQQTWVKYFLPLVITSPPWRTEEAGRPGEDCEEEAEKLLESKHVWCHVRELGGSYNTNYN